MLHGLGLPIWYLRPCHNTYSLELQPYQYTLLALENHYQGHKHSPTSHSYSTQTSASPSRPPPHQSEPPGTCP
uniref:Uncharacterized protein n=1 Tax=Lotus japonicus TaxID=34305 RepID=I3S7X4_LOTJA|nr:unknown [Lotus japonicus]